MSAGLSTKQINSRIYNRLQTIKRQLSRAGVPSTYHAHQLCRFETVNTPNIGGWNISFRVIRASNGESAGTPSLYITNSLQGGFHFGGWDADNNGAFADGIKKLIELYAEVQYDGHLLPWPHHCLECVKHPELEKCQAVKGSTLCYRHQPEVKS
jgi:hypothetical protein